MASNRHLGRIIALQTLFEQDFRRAAGDKTFDLEEVLRRNVERYKATVDDHSPRCLECIDYISGTFICGLRAMARGVNRAIEFHAIAPDFVQLGMLSVIGDPHGFGKRERDHPRMTIQHGAEDPGTVAAFDYRRHLEFALH